MKNLLGFTVITLATFLAACSSDAGAQILKLKKPPPPPSQVPNEPTPAMPTPDTEARHPLLHPHHGRDGKDGQPGMPGKDAPAVDLSPILDALAKMDRRIDDLAKQQAKDGSPGKDGRDGKDAPAVDLSAVAAAIARLEARLDGIKPVPPVIIRGEPGQPGAPATINYDQLAEEIKKRLPPQPAYFEIVPLRK